MSIKHEITEAIIHEAEKQRGHKYLSGSLLRNKNDNYWRFEVLDGVVRVGRCDLFLSPIEKRDWELARMDFDELWEFVEGDWAAKAKTS